MQATYKLQAGVFVMGIMAAFVAHGHAGHDAKPAQGDGAHAHTIQVFPDPVTAEAPDGVVAGACWIRALPNPLPKAAYFSLENQGGHDVVLVGAQSEGFGSVMLHTHAQANGMSSMQHVDRVPVSAGQGVEFAPGGHHVMLQKPEINLEVGGQHVITLWFEGNRALPVRCDVRPAGATTSEAQGF